MPLTNKEKALSRRSLLYVPATRPKFFESAINCNPDAVILDLEDSVPLADKPLAREALKRATERFNGGNLDVLIRVNKPFELLIYDLDEAIKAGPTGLFIPKVESAEEVRILEAMIAEREIKLGLAQGEIELHLIVESCKGLLNIKEIASASNRIVSLSLGTEDLSKELEVDPSSPGFDITWAHSLILVAAKANGLAPYGLLGGFTNYTDVEQYQNFAVRSREFGYIGSSCIHPRQVAVLNQYFIPSEEETQNALKIVQAFEEAYANGSASIAVDGKMVDIPIYDRARNILRRSRVKA